MGAGCAKGWVQSTIMSLPQKALFNNHGSIAEEQEFVCREVAKLLASGAVTEIQRALVKHWRSKGFRIFSYSPTSIKRPPIKRPPSIKRPLSKVPIYLSVNCCT